MLDSILLLFDPEPFRNQGSVICSVLVKHIFFAGSLTVYMKPANGKRLKIFSASLNQGDLWRHGRGNIFSDLMEWQVQEGAQLQHNLEPHQRLWVEMLAVLHSPVSK